MKSESENSWCAGSRSVLAFPHIVPERRKVIVRKGTGRLGERLRKRAEIRNVGIQMPDGKHLAETLGDIAQKRAEMKKDARRIAGLKRRTRRLLDEMEAHG